MFAVTGFFESLFLSLNVIFQCEPMLYLLGILVLAFVVFAMKMIIRH